MKSWSPREALARLARRLRAAPVFTAFAVVTLAIGIGATTAIYAVAEAVLFRPFDIRDLDEVVNVYHHDPRRVTAGHQMALSWPDAEAIAGQQAVFTEVMLWARFNVPLTGDGRFTPLMGELVSGNYFPFVGARPQLGRAIQLADDEPGAPAVVVISEALWRGRFGGDPGVIGRVITLGTMRAEVVGVMPAAFRGVDMPNVMPTAAWMPLAQAERAGTIRHAAAWHEPETRWVLLKGRLAPGRTIEQARSDIAAIGHSLDRDQPIGSADRRPLGRPEDVRLFAALRASDLHMHESVDRLAVPTGQALLAAVGLVLLVACTNLANLLLARGAGRRQEVAVRRALGASRGQVMRELTADSLAIAAAGGLLGLLFAAWLVALLSGPLPIGNGLALTVEPRLTGRVVGVVVLSTAAALVVFGLIPAWHTTRGGLRQVLDAHTGGALARWRGRRVLIAAQILVSVALLVPGALLVQQAVGKATHHPGFDLDRLAVAQINYQALDRTAPDADPDALAARRARRLDLLTSGVDALRRAPGVGAATLSNRIPVYFSTAPAVLVSHVPPEPRDDRAAPSASQLQRVAYVTVGDAAIFDTLGIPILAGRGYDAEEVAARAPVVVVSESVARAVFQSETVVGRTLYLGADPVTVVGVAGETDWGRIGSRLRGSVYRPGQPDPAQPVVVAARAAGGVDVALGVLREALRGVDPELPVIEATTGPAIARSQTMFDRVGAGIISLLGGFAMLLALTGLTGLLTFVVASRRREIGVRMALGADRGRVVRLVLGDGLRPVLYGGALGLAAGAGLSRLIAGYYYRLPGLDWNGIVLIAALLAPAAALACYVPAKRAAAVDPNVTLREL